MNIELQGQLTQREYSAANWLHIKPRPVLAVLGIFILGLAIWALWMTFFSSTRAHGSIAAWAVLIGLVYFAFVYLVWQPLKWRKLYRQHKDLHRPLRMIITEDSLKAENETGSGTIAWRDLVKWKEGHGLFLLYPNEALFYVIPARLFSSIEQVEQFRQLLSRAIGK